VQEKSYAAGKMLILDDEHVGWILVENPSQAEYKRLGEEMYKIGNGVSSVLLFFVYQKETLI
jgi:hypothetical protein